ncbi:MAG TPA: DNA polymerase I [Acidimicrobiales bacterium]|nr:DNA polymerase I [Acidimicrobiales bacterium]
MAAPVVAPVTAATAATATAADQGQRPLLLLDGMSLAFRAYFALPPDLVTTSGLVTNAVHGFVSMLVYMVREHRPSALAVAFDPPGGNFRDDMVEDYKGGRAATPDDLLPQFGMIRQVLAALNIPVVEVPTFEADDVLATLATQARDRHCPVIVVTGDRDCFQLVEDPYVRVLYNRRGVSDYSLYDEAGIVDRTGVTPDRYPMLAALRGDTSDNLPGVPGVGEKTAAKLINAYGDLDGVYANLDAQTPKLRQNLAAHEAQARANAAVTPLVREVPLDVSVDQLALGGWDLDTARDVFATLELKNVWQRITALLRDGSFGPPREGSAPLDDDPSAAQASAAGGAASAAAGDGAPAAGVGEGVGVVEDLDPDRPGTADDAVAALGGLVDRVTGDAVLSVAGRWEGTPGRSPLRGLAVVVDGPDPHGVWLDAALLEADLDVDGPLRAALTAALDRGPVVGHDVKELLRSLLPLGVDCTGLAMDTKVAAYLLDPSSGDYSLDTVAGAGSPSGPAEGRAVVGQLALGGLDGAMGGADAEPPAELAADQLDAAEARKVATEALRVAALVPVERARLDAEGMRALHDDVETPLVRVLARMEVVGIRVDTVELRRIADALVTETQRLVAEVHRLAGHEFNVNSTPQLRTVLYDELGLTPGRKTKTGYSTDAATLESLRDDHAIVDTLLRYREVEKLRSTYGEALLAEVAADGRIHASFRQTVARTGRLSSERPNLHNIPTRTDAGQQFRRAFVPADGCRFLVADYDQVELRVLAHLSGDPGLVAAFTSGDDIHRAVAAGIYRVPPDEVTRVQRDRAKMVSYGLVYGMEAFGLARRLSTGVDEAAEIMDRYFGGFPEVRAYMDHTVAEARERGYTRTALGRKRPLPELSDRNYRVRQAAERQAMNAGIQGLAADLFKVALVRLDRALEDAGLASRLVLQVHDEVIVEVRDGEDDRVAALTEDALTGAADLSVPLKVSTAWGSSWADAKGG